MWGIYEYQSVRAHLRKEEFLIRFCGFVRGLKPYAELVEALYSDMGDWVTDDCDKLLYTPSKTGGYSSLEEKIQYLLDYEKIDSGKHVVMMSLRLSLAAVVVAIIQFGS